MIISIDFILLIKTRTLFQFFVHQSKHGNKPEITVYIYSVLKLSVLHNIELE